MVGRIAKEDTRDRARSKFVSHSYRSVRIAKATKNLEMRVGKQNLKQGLKWCGKGDGFGGKAIQEVSHHMK